MPPSPSGGTRSYCSSIFNLDLIDNADYVTAFLYSDGLLLRRTLQHSVILMNLDCLKN